MLTVVLVFTRFPIRRSRREILRVRDKLGVFLSQSHLVIRETDMIDPPVVSLRRARALVLVLEVTIQRRFSVPIALRPPRVLGIGNGVRFIRFVYARRDRHRARRVLRPHTTSMRPARGRAFRAFLSFDGTSIT